jgi:hypothetical protein
MEGQTFFQILDRNGKVVLVGSKETFSDQSVAEEHASRMGRHSIGDAEYTVEKVAVAPVFMVRSHQIITEERLDEKEGNGNADS